MGLGPYNGNNNIPPTDSNDPIQRGRTSNNEETEGLNNVTDEPGNLLPELSREEITRALHQAIQEDEGTQRSRRSLFQELLNDFATGFIGRNAVDLSFETMLRLANTYEQLNRRTARLRNGVENIHNNIIRSSGNLISDSLENNPFLFEIPFLSANEPVSIFTRGTNSEQFSKFLSKLDKLIDEEQRNSKRSLTKISTKISNFKNNFKPSYQNEDNSVRASKISDYILENGLKNSQIKKVIYEPDGIVNFMERTPRSFSFYNRHPILLAIKIAEYQDEDLSTNLKTPKAGDLFKIALPRLFDLDVAGNTVANLDLIPKLDSKFINKLKEVDGFESSVDESILLTHEALSELEDSPSLRKKELSEALIALYASKLSILFDQNNTKNINDFEVGCIFDLAIRANGVDELLTQIDLKCDDKKVLMNYLKDNFMKYSLNTYEGTIQNFKSDSNPNSIYRKPIVNLMKMAMFTGSEEVIGELRDLFSENELEKLNLLTALNSGFASDDDVGDLTKLVNIWFKDKGIYETISENECEDYLYDIFKLYDKLVPVNTDGDQLTNISQLNSDIYKYIPEKLRLKINYPKKFLNNVYLEAKDFGEQWNKLEKNRESIISFVEEKDLTHFNSNPRAIRSLHPVFDSLVKFWEGDGFLRGKPALIKPFISKIWNKRQESSESKTFEDLTLALNEFFIPIRVESDNNRIARILNITNEAMFTKPSS
ncbi:MAG: hypothetical protein HRT47_05680 [Candidatus Caenarcaniphilales bacterium]|nr:hypothetical protein [Candidatus Caenarcaniphilales bacterium]